MADNRGDDEEMKPLKVRCFFCKEIVLDITCGKAEVSRMINSSPKIMEKKMVYRCEECKNKQKAERKRRG